MDQSSLIYPIFVKEGSGIVEEIPTMPGQYRYSIDTMGRKLEALIDAGVSSVMFSEYRIIKMKLEARRMQRTESSRKRCRKRQKSIRSCTGSRMSACASILPTVIAASSADRK